MKKQILSVATALEVSLSLICCVSTNDDEALTIDDFEYSTECFYDPEIYTESVDYTLYDRFVKYDLCITDYDLLTDEEKELCRFIFERERSANHTIRCERARRILAGDDVGDRINISDLEGKRCIIDPVNGIRGIVYDYVYCVPDIIHLDADVGASEYWLDDSGNERILFDGNVGSEFFGYVEFPDSLPEVENNWTDYYQMSDGCVLRCVNIPVTESLNPDNAIVKDGITYYILPDGSLVAAESDYNYNYEIVEETVVIPDEIDGRKVTMLAGAMAYSGITNIILPETLTYILPNAFANCENLKKLEINCPEAVIEDGAFYLSGIQSITITAKVIGERVFADCTQLETVTLNRVEEIDAYAFEGCTALSEIKLPETLMVIGQMAFCKTSLVSITVPAGTEIIGAFPERHGDYGGFLFDYPANDPLSESDLLISDDDCTICGYYSTEAHSYALENNLKFNALDELEYGDTNLDGSINVANAVVLQNYLLRGESVGYEADLNKDGRIDVFDMIAMRNSLVINK